MKVIYTHFSTDLQSDSAGFNTTKDLAFILSLSVEYSKKYYKDIQLVTNKRGKELLIDKYKVGFTSVDTSLEGLECPQDLFAWAKIKAYSLQKEPFISIDLDAIVWEKIPTRFLKAPLFFQNNEPFAIQQGYTYLTKLISTTTVAYFCRRLKTSQAYNCGIIGINNLDLIKEWYRIAEDLIFNPENQHFWASLENKTQMNYIFEQYFIACIAKNEGLENEVKFLIKDVDYKNVSKPKLQLTHLWGDSKRKQSELIKLKERLKKEFPRKYKHINSIEVNPKEVYASFFYKGTQKWQRTLNYFLLNNKIKSIVYLCYDGKKSSRLINEFGEITDFIYTNNFPKCDLAIIKDALPIWTGKEYVNFCAKNEAKYIMDNRQVI